MLQLASLTQFPASQYFDTPIRSFTVNNARKMVGFVSHHVDRRAKNALRKLRAVSRRWSAEITLHAAKAVVPHTLVCYTRLLGEFD